MIVAFSPRSPTPSAPLFPFPIPFMYNEPGLRRFPKVPIQRRAGAFLIDFVTVGLICIPFADSNRGFSFLQVIVFIFAWFGLRIVLVMRNQGQSLGRWALDMKVVDVRLTKTPAFYELGIREGISGFGSLLAMIGISIGVANGISLILLLAPLVVDCGFALTDSELQLAFHDRIARTAIVASQRGFSLDLRLKKLVAILRRRMK